MFGLWRMYLDNRNEPFEPEFVPPDLAQRIDHFQAWAAREWPVSNEERNGMPIAESLDVPPQNRLSVQPVCESMEDLGKGLTELAWLKSLRETRQKSCDAQIALIKRTFDDELTIRVGRQRQTIPNREETLSEEIKRFVKKHRAKLLQAWGAKSCTFSHGSISFRDQPAKVAYQKGETLASVIAAIEKKVDPKKTLISRMLDVLKKCKVFGTVTCNYFLDVKLTVSLSRIKAALKDGTLQPKELEKFGLTYVEKTEAIRVDVTEYTLSNAQASEMG